MPNGEHGFLNTLILLKIEEKIEQKLCMISDSVVLQCEAVGRVADIIQIPAFLCRQVKSPDSSSF